MLFTDIIVFDEMHPRMPRSLDIQAAPVAEPLLAAAAMRFGLAISGSRIPAGMAISWTH
tara:strand:+ start:8420 stop:8596 length:177 start_codon:yes stop_codon:yes gene_type:complete